MRIDVVGLRKCYGQVEALADVTLRAGPGRVLGVLGHNGAGKTTLVDILATRTLPTAGTARVCGFDVVRNPRQVRRVIGVTGQATAVDGALPGRDNLVLVARLLGANPRQAGDRAEELIEAFGLGDVAGRPAATYSGGLLRRLDLAMSLVGRPVVLFLDEPSTGLDPVGRTELWRLVGDLAADGTTVVLTTQYLDEADELATDVVVLGAGRVVASGTPAQLKSAIGTRTATVRFADDRTAVSAAGLFSRVGLTAAPLERQVTVSLAAAADVTTVVRALDTVGIEPADLTVAEPTLTDVYLALHREQGVR
ncbi:ATP-binding cassette domain-containing protein [Amycolatopsis suaedae]|uniref:ATP-binding cassette domain-containing protein n=1 Tax=Amycolatopsis suaedae TaxID=2510978 RepID=A0A4Q7JFV8_9PSEU|nr:ATP-binding cassette domain-containing protein [Amycolatopsis suaedae]RZQ65823.1 ATP-binding cassette domain-containing protein [Amycolatopsis suaedae]